METDQLIIPSTTEEVEFIDNKLGEFNKSQLQYTKQMDFILLNFPIKDEQGQIIAGINALSCWQMYISLSMGNAQSRTDSESIRRNLNSHRYL